MKSLGKIFGSMLIMTTVLACREPFMPDVDFEDTNFLVVEGYIAVGDGETTIRLSRARRVDSRDSISGEPEASVVVEAEDGHIFPLDEISYGTYSAALNLSTGTRYRILISTQDGKQYRSEYTQPIMTPAIDSVFWSRKDPGVVISIATHDPSNNTRFYQWEFEEAWEVESSFLSVLKYENDTLVSRPENERLSMKTCYRTKHPTDLIYLSTSNLAQDKVSLVLRSIIEGDERFAKQYSILVRQHAISQDAFDYLTLMEKNTGPLGSFFDPQPSELIGNITCLNSDEPVVGFIDAATTAEELVFIQSTDVLNWNFDLPCEMETTPVHADSLKLYFEENSFVPIAPFSIDWLTGKVTDISYARGFCADCRMRDAVNKRPEYWN